MASAELDWDCSLASMDSCIAAGYFTVCQAQVNHRIYSVLEIFADRCNFQASLFDVKSWGVRYRLFEKAWKRCLHSCTISFQGNENSVPRRLVVCGTQILDVGDYAIDLHNRDKGMTRYLLTKKQLLDFIEDDDYLVWAGQKRAALDEWLGWLATLLSVACGNNEPSVLLQSCGTYLLAWKEYP